VKVYLYAPPTDRRDLNANYTRIKEALKQVEGLWLSSNTERHEVNLPPESLTRAEETQTPLLDQVDAIVLEGSTSDAQIGYLLAYAISTVKPCLYLFERRGEAQLFRHLKPAQIPKTVRAVRYTRSNLAATIHGFLGTVSGIEIREAPRIKFTLRITKTIEQYLGFKTANTSLTKADWLRGEIERLMREDPKFRDFLKSLGSR
jgi:hypothetical protein